MDVFAGSLDGLVGFSFTGAQVGGLTVTGSTQTGAGTFNAAVTSLSATTTGTMVSLFDAGATYTVTSVNDTANTIMLQESGVFTLTLYVVGYTGSSLLVALEPQSTLANALASNINVNSDIGVLATSAYPADQALSWTSTGAYTGAAPCFVRGTRIRTGRGEVAVEDLREGDLVQTLVPGGELRVRWIGHRTLAPARNDAPWDVAPVRVRAGAFAENMPRRDLLLSPDHAVFVAGALVPVRHLLNGATIVQETVASVGYFHVELERHAVLLAEGLPAESYLDTGNRGAFANAPGPVSLTPRFARDAWAAHGCAPLLTAGPEVAALHQLLLDRAGELGWRFTADPGLGVLAGGRRLRARRTVEGWQVVLPPGTPEVRLVSRAVVPMQISHGAPERRRLGVAVADLRLDGASPGAAAFRGGWHAAEVEWRWTDGDAGLETDGAARLSFRVTMSETYWAPPPLARRPAARAALGQPNARCAAS